MPVAVLSGIRAAIEKDRAQFFRDVANWPFFGLNLPNATRSQGLADAWFHQAMQSGIKATYNTTWSWEIDYSEDLKKLKNVPVLFIQGDADQIVPIEAGTYAGIKLLPKSTFKVYPGGAHALPNTEPEEINWDLLNFLTSGGAHLLPQIEP